MPDRKHMLKVLGMDPSLSNWGLAYGLYNLKTQTLRLKTAQVIQTQKAKKASKVSLDDLIRARQLSDCAFQAAQQADVVFVEVPTGSQSARAMASYGIVVGILASLRTNDLPFIEVTPMQLKMATIGKKSASKQSIISRAFELHPQLDWPMSTYEGITSLAKKSEHIADAIGAIEAGVLTDDFQQLLALRR